MSQEVTPASTVTPSAPVEVKPAEGATPTPPTPAAVTPEVPTKTPEEAAPVVPEKYDLKLSEGSYLADQFFLDELTSELKEAGLSNEQAQLELERREKIVADVNARRKTEWIKAAQADKEIGGEKLKESLELSRRVIERFDPEILAELDSSGFGNSPKVIRLFTRIGKAMSDDTLVVKGTQGAGRPPIEQRLYPNHKEN